MAAPINPARGNRLPQAKLSPDVVSYIRENRRGETARQLAERFGVHSNTIDRCRWGVTYGDVEEAALQEQDE